MFNFVSVSDCLSSEHLNHSAKSVLGFWLPASGERVYVNECVAAHYGHQWMSVDLALFLHVQPCMCTYATDTLVCLFGAEQTVDAFPLAHDVISLMRLAEGLWVMEIKSAS